MFDARPIEFAIAGLLALLVLAAWFLGLVWMLGGFY
jgi:hypothetical protein